MPCGATSLNACSPTARPSRVEKAKIALLAAAEELRRREESAAAAAQAAQTMMASMDRYRRRGFPRRRHFPLLSTPKSRKRPPAPARGLTKRGVRAPRRLEEEAAIARQQNDAALDEARAGLDEATREAQARARV